MNVSFKILKDAPKSRVLLVVTLLWLSACSALVPGNSSVDAEFRPGVPGGTQVAPLAESSTLNTNKNISASSTLRASDRNPADTLTFSVVSQPSKGSVVITNATTGAFRFTPTQNLSGSDSFTFKSNDGLANSNIAIVSIMITDTVRAPVTSDITPASFNEDTQSGVITLSYTDPDGDLASACTISNLQNLSVTSACVCNVSGVCTLRVTGDANFNGSASFDYTVTAGSQLSNTASASLTVNPVDDAPVASGVTVAAFDEDAESPAITLPYTDVEGDPAASCTLSGLNQVTLSTPCTCDGSGVCTVKVTGASNYTGSASFNYTVTVSGLSSAAASAALTMSPVNDAPLANAQSVSTSEDVAKVLALGASDIEGGTLTYTVLALPTHGALSGTAPNLTYTPTANYNGADSFTFKVNDGSLDSNTATVSITVTSVNDAPVASAQSSSTNEDSAKAITLSASDSEGDTLTYSIVSNPTHGVLSGTAPNLNYTPAANYNGADSFSFKTNDGSVDSNTATVSITVNAVNDNPVAGAQSVSVDKNVATALTLAATDVDTGATLSYAVLSSPSHGVLSGTAPTLTFTPTTNYVGSDLFTFKASDGTVDSNTATITLIIGSNNSAPVSSNQSVSTNEDTATAITLGSTDAEGDTLSYSIVSGPTFGALSGSGASLSYTPIADWSGSVSFTFKTNDGSVDSNVATVTVTVVAVNDAPVASAQSVSTSEDTAKSITLAATDVEGNTLTYSIVSGPTHGALSGSAPNLSYTPSANYNGADSFTFKANDGTGDSNTAAVSVTVNAVDDAPLAAAISPAAFNEDTQSGVITLSYTDADSDLATDCMISATSQVSVTSACSCNGSGVCSVRVTGSSNYSGAASFSYTVAANSNTSNTATASLSITAVNDAPTISDITDTSTNEDAARAVSFAINDIDHTLACTSANLSMSSSNTTLIPNANIVWSGTAPNCTGTISPAANGYGTATLTVTASDGALTSSDAFVLSVVRLTDDSWTSPWPFDALSDAFYSISDTAKIDLAGGVARLSAKDQTDDDNACTGFGDNITSGCGGTYVGTTYDTLQDTSSGVKLDAASPELEMSSNWTPQWSSLVSYWKFNETSWSGTTSEVTDSKGSSHGTAQNSASTTSASKLGAYAGVFDGTNDYIELGTGTALKSSTFSWSLWVKFSTSQSSRTIMGFHRDSSAAGGASIGIDDSVANRIKVHTDTYSSRVNSSRTLNDGVWHHLFVTYGSSTLKLYVDGNLDATNSSVGAPRAGSYSNNFQIGKWSGGSQYFNGVVDDVAIWSSVLNADEVKAIYSRQSSKYAGTFTSRLMDIGASNSWTSLNWFPTLPFMKELPDYSGGAVQNETSSNYSALIGSTGNTGDNDLMTGIIGLWHFNETAATAGAGNDFKDDSGRGNNVEASGGATFGLAGRLGNAVTLNGTTGYVGLGRAGVLDTATSTSFSFAAWANPTSLPATTCAVNTSTCHSAILMRQGWHTGLSLGKDGTFACSIYNSSNAEFTVRSSASSVATWHHVAMAVDDTAKKLHCLVNGVPVSGSPMTYTGSLRSYATNYNVGFANASHPLTTGSHAWPFSGSIDEVAIWSRALHVNEMKQLYQRGGSRIKFQTRACAASPCNESTETWKGPDGTSSTYFSELNNNTVPLDGTGDVKKTLPSMTLSSHTGRYFQYRAILESDSNTVALGPELKKLSVGPDHYDTSAPTIGNASPIDFQTLTTFTPTASCSTNERYILSSNGGTNWSYYNGSAWAAADGTSYSQASTSAQISSGLASLPTGTGNLLYRAFLKSDGQSTCSLTQLDLGGLK